MNRRAFIRSVASTLGVSVAALAGVPLPKLPVRRESWISSGPGDPPQRLTVTETEFLNEWYETTRAAVEERERVARREWRASMRRAMSKKRVRFDGTHMRLPL
jgi:hypothetical protein